MEDKQALIGALAHWLKAGKLEAGMVLPAMESLAGGSTASLLEVYETLKGEPEEAVQKLAGHVWAVLREEALRGYQKGSEWQVESNPEAAVENAIRTVCDLAYLAGHQEKAPELFRRVQVRSVTAMAAAQAAIKGLAFAPVWPESWPGRDRVLSELNKAQAPLDLASACGCATPAGIPALLRMTEGTQAQDQAMLLLTRRFGQPGLTTWNAWVQWLSFQAGIWKAAEESFERLIQKHPAGVLLILYSRLPDPDPAVLDALVKMVGATEPQVEAANLVESWSKWLLVNERCALLGEQEPEAPPIISPPLASFTPQPMAESGEIPASPVEPPAPPKPGLWEKHLQPFFVENWYIVAGIAMVILGSSLLAYYTWDKHWLLRYTIMPSLLALFTWSLAGAGRWIEKRGEEFKGTAAILRGAAIGLLPINFMTMALLSADEKVSEKGPALMIMGAIYLVVFGWGLRSWCRAVQPALGNLLGGTLLLLNSLVAVVPLARTLGNLDGTPLLYCLGAGFYLGFVVMAAAIVRFSRKILTREMAEEKRVPWFVAGALAITFVQVFVWVHGFMRHVPQAHTYALLVIMIGWLVLYVERRALLLRESSQLHGGESFLGFALILLGLLMGFGQPTIRMAAFAMAGAVWMYQALARRHPLHYWIALTLWALGVASIGLLPGYPPALLPMLGVLLAVGFGLGSRFSLARGREDLTEVCRGMQVAALFITTMVAPLAQWHYQLNPLETAGWLLAVAALFGWRALQDQKIHWLHATMLILALVLPYAGCMDMAHRTAHHNTMVFGTALLSFFWLMATRLRPTPLMLQARSTVLWFYGILGLAGMLLRVVLGDAAPDPLWYRDYMDYLGPILMMLVLVPATYHSRSLVPAGMAVGIMAILFPELRANLQQSLPLLSWGSGFGSALCGLGLVWLCFILRPWKFLQQLPEGDRFMGKEPFPLQRFNHTLFTWPIMAAAVFLMVKVESWNLLRNYFGGGVQIKTALALGLTGVAWTLFAIYRREHRSAVVAVHLGWIWAAAGIFFGYWRLATDQFWAWPFLYTGVLLQGLYWFYKYVLEKSHPWVKSLLTEPMKVVLMAGSGALAIICTVALWAGAPLGQMQWLYFFLAAQLIWHALAGRQQVMGVILFFLGWTGLLTTTTPGLGWLVDRISIGQSLSPTLWLLMGIQVAYLVLEKARVLQTRLFPLLNPAFGIGSTVVFLLGLGGLADGLHGQALSATQQALLLVTLLLTARTQASGIFFLLASLLGYLMVHRDMLISAGDLERQIELLVLPWHLALLGLCLALLGRAVQWVQKSGWITAPFAQPFFTARSCGWIFAPAAVVSAVGAFYHTFHPVLRESAVQLWSPYTGAVTLALVAWFWPRVRLFAGAGFLLMMGNIHLVRVFGGDFLRGHGLAETHLVCLGLSLTLLQSSILRRVIRPVPAIAGINLASLGLGGFVLVLLSASYFTDPNLAAISSMRFIISGTMAWLAGQYFRRAARHPGPGEEAHISLCEALYHFGVVMALWCAVLLIPWFRNPAFTLIALALPVAYFYGRAEAGMRSAAAEAVRYRNSAAVLGCLVLGLYVFKGIFHLVLFPEMPVRVEHYHDNAIIVMLLGLVLMRLRGLGGNIWLAFYGGLALMGGSYFLLTALPELSPFHYPMAGAWCAVALGHFWILASHTRSPLRTGLQRLAKLDDAVWQELRHWWGLCLLAATHGAVIWGITEYNNNPSMVAPLLLGAASILIHQGVIRQIAAKVAIAHYLMAAMEVALALHMDFFIPSYLPKEDVIWVLLLLWLGLLTAHRFFASKLKPETVGVIALALGAFVLAHVLYHRPWSLTGLWGVALGAVLAAWNPQRNRLAANPLEQFCSMLLLGVPVWLVYFSQAPLEERGFQGALESWPVLATTATLFLTGLFARLFPVYLATGYHGWARSRFCLFDSTLSWITLAGPLIHRATLWITFVVVGLAQVLHYQTAFTTAEFILVTALEAALAVAWFYEGRNRESMVAYYMMQFSAVACCAAVRRHLMLTIGSWNYDYDVWISLGFSFALTGVKQIFSTKPKAVRVPLLTSMFVLPATALIWVIVHGLGVDMALMVVGLQSVLFAYMGKDDRESPYNIVALTGFVAFVLVAFYSKLQLRAVHAYIIPVGLGVLVLQELFRSRIRPESGNWIRLITLMAMLGSTGYYALADARYAITFNLTMIALCLLAMGLGSFMKVRMYLALGFAGLMVDLVSILYKVLVLMERNSRMTVIGVMVLIIGAGLVFGAIYYKTNKAKFDALTAHWRGKLGQWQ